MRQGKNRKNEGDLALKQSNVETFGATSRRSRQRRDVPERIFANVAPLKATSRRSREY